MPSQAHRRRTTDNRWSRLRSGFANRPIGWRLSVPVACACAGLLASTSMINARGTDLRSGRHTDLIGLVSEQKTSVAVLRRTVRSLASEVDDLSRHVGGTRVRTIHRQIDRLDAAGGLAGLRAPGLVISLDDAPADQEEVDGVDPNVLLVHQQDLQAVVNALWAGGADAISLQGQRIIATTGIKCVGNTVLLQGVPYSPPYQIKAVGDPEALDDALDQSPEVQSYLDFTQAPYNLGWSVRAGSAVTVPPYAGTLQLEFARPVTAPDDAGSGD